jgi:hypothetical protein
MSGMLVTGAGGFVGLFLLRRLDLGNWAGPLAGTGYCRDVRLGRAQSQVPEPS